MVFESFYASYGYPKLTSISYGFSLSILAAGRCLVTCNDIRLVVYIRLFKHFRPRCQDKACRQLAENKNGVYSAI